jgi:hypothetical protein
VLDAEIQEKLHHVKVGGRVNLRLFPDFLIVGPQRTGTTWLHAHLRHHPEIFLSEPKELFFFSRLKAPADPKFQSDDLGWYLRFFRDPPWRWLMKNAICLQRYGRQYAPRVRGEATASYSALDPDVIEEITLLNPEIKAILVIRNPVDRAWSHAKKDLCRRSKREVRDVPEKEFHDFFKNAYQRRCAQYVENCENWASFVAPRHLMVLLFDDIRGRPHELLLETMRFLGVDADRRFISDDVHASVNPTRPTRMPDKYRHFLEELLAPEIEVLRRKFGLSWPLGEHPLVRLMPD